MKDAESYIDGIERVVGELRGRLDDCTWNVNSPNFFFACREDELLPMATNMQYLQMQTTLMNRPTVMDTLMTLSRQMQVCVGPRHQVKVEMASLAGNLKKHKGKKKVEIKPKLKHNNKKEQEM